MPAPCLDDFVPGAIFRHWPGKTVTEADHVLFCLLTHNTHPIHIDAHYAKSATRHGRVLVVSSYLFSVLLGISTADILRNATRHLDFQSIRHVAPVFHGDTIHGESTVLDVEPAQEGNSTGIVSLETRGYNQDGVLVISFLSRVAIRRSSDSAADTPADEAQAQS
ncbi:MaoC family dehydratase [Mycobacterium sp. KBS0706]|uniref:MaoC family dehydratase n=1 Tax=Mycobacterium sp. KBS0706 TaxID=2578109 RepID=UPI00110FB0E4|nr:MaoC family dehydratase [Mycobacterium sp. KBS0706]TSD90163.1 MaoC family dehydratase [Mycobacterium sp. KBS0706]